MAEQTHIACGDRVCHEQYGEGIVMGPSESNPRGVVVRWDDGTWTHAYLGELERVGGHGS